MKKYGTEYSITLKNEVHDINRLLCTDNFKEFINILSLIAQRASLKDKSIMFIFPRSLTCQERHSIHCMQLRNKMKTVTYNDTLCVFVKEHIYNQPVQGVYPSTELSEARKLRKHSSLNDIDE